MKINKKKFIYLISPNNIYTQFYKDLRKVLSTGKVSFFQLRLKKYTIKNKFFIGKKIQKICKKYCVKFLVNDDPFLAKKLNADGCHIGQKDTSISEARKIVGNKIIGITCHNSIKLAKAAIKEKANYIAFGAFFSTKTKKVKYRATIEVLNKVKKITKTPMVAIGGINNNNYKKLLLNNANLLAISSYVWNNKKFKPLETIKNLK
ncbi:thiamine phosphate synthase [Candidatus Pelagibacter sp.]|nr:thiamine phosphate synthase [Candidatus Pelagibacter sp.]